MFLIIPTIFLIKGIQIKENKIKNALFPDDRVHILCVFKIDWNLKQKSFETSLNYLKQSNFAWLFFH